MVAVVTGYTSDIGECIAKEFALAGTNVILLGRQEPGKAFSNKELYKHYFLDFSSLSFEEDMDSIVNNLEGKKIKYVVHTSAISGVRQPLEKTSYNQIRQVSDVNLVNTVWFISRICDLIIRSKISHSSIVCISSQLAKYKGPGLAMYSATKAALNSLCRTLSDEYGRHGIRINSVSPGMLQNKANLQSRSSKELGIPLDRFAEPDDIWNAVKFLCDSKSSYITGSDIVVNGGR